MSALMNHDIAHCDGVGCDEKMRETCKRFLAHIDAERRKLKIVCYTTCMYMGGGCPMYQKK